MYYSGFVLFIYLHQNLIVVSAFRWSPNQITSFRGTSGSIAIVASHIKPFLTSCLSANKTTDKKWAKKKKKRTKTKVILSSFRNWKIVHAFKKRTIINEHATHTHTHTHTHTCQYSHNREKKIFFYRITLSGLRRPMVFTTNPRTPNALHTICIT